MKLALKELYGQLKVGDVVTVTIPIEAYENCYRSPLVYLQPNVQAIVGSVHVPSVRYSPKYQQYRDEMVCLDWIEDGVEYRCAARYQEIILVHSV